MRRKPTPAIYTFWEDPDPMKNSLRPKFQVELNVRDNYDFHELYTKGKKT